MVKWLLGMERCVFKPSSNVEDAGLVGVPGTVHRI